MPRLHRKDAAEVIVEIGGPMERVLLALPFIMLAQSNSNFRKRLDLASNTIAWTSAGNFFHQLINIFQFSQSSPAAIATSPVRTRLKPDGESLGKIFRRMGLRIPGIEVEDIAPAVGLRFIRGWIGSRKRAKGPSPAALEVQTERIIDGVSGFVTKNSHALDISAALDF